MVCVIFYLHLIRSALFLFKSCRRPQYEYGLRLSVRVCSIFLCRLGREEYSPGYKSAVLMPQDWRTNVDEVCQGRTSRLAFKGSWGVVVSHCLYTGDHNEKCWEYERPQSYIYIYIYIDGRIERAWHPLRFLLLSCFFYILYTPALPYP